MRALVTGGTRGIGLSVCRLLSERGERVTALYHADEAAADLARKALPSVEFLRADVSDEGTVREIFSRISSLDHLVNNAGISHFAQVQDTSLADWNRVMAVNAGGVFLCCKYAVKKMLERGGAIVNVYSASKGALIAFTKALARELALSSITVNCVSPGVIDTAMNARFSEEERRALKEEIPLGRFGTSEEVARAVLFLLDNRYVTGQVLGINGGFC